MSTMGTSRQEYIAKTTAAVAGDAIGVVAGRAGLTFAVTGVLAAGVEIPIEYLDADDEWQPLIEGGVPVVLSASDNAVGTDKILICRANKPETVAAVGVTVFR